MRNNHILTRREHQQHSCNDSTLPFEKATTFLDVTLNKYNSCGPIYAKLFVARNIPISLKLYELSLC